MYRCSRLGLIGALLREVISDSVVYWRMGPGKGPVYLPNRVHLYGQRCGKTWMPQLGLGVVRVPWSGQESGRVRLRHLLLEYYCYTVDGSRGALRFHLVDILTTLWAPDTPRAPLVPAGVLSR